MIPKRTYDPKKYKGISLKDTIGILIQDYTEYELSHISLTNYYLSKQTGLPYEKIRQAYYELRHPKRRKE